MAKRDLPRVDCTSLMSTLHPRCLTPFTLRWISFDWLNGCCMVSADSPRRDEFTASPHWKQLIFNSHLILHRQRLTLKVPLQRGLLPPQGSVQFNCWVDIRNTASSTLGPYLYPFARSIQCLVISGLGECVNGVDASCRGIDVGVNTLCECSRLHKGGSCLVWLPRRRQVGMGRFILGGSWIGQDTVERSCGCWRGYMEAMVEGQFSEPPRRAPATHLQVIAFN
jgi:hypothetical protein